MKPPTIHECCAYIFCSKNSFYLCAYKPHQQVQSCWCSFALPAWEPTAMEQSRAEGGQSPSGKYWLAEGWQMQGVGYSLERKHFVLYWMPAVILTSLFHYKPVGFQGGKGTFLKCIQNIFDQSVNLSRVINYISVQKRVITYNFMINEWQFALFFFC